MPSGKIFGVGLALFTLVFGVALWWFQTQAFYERVTGVDRIRVADAMIPVSGYVGIDAASSPLKLRGCMTVDPALFPLQKQAAKPTPLVAPDWFTCFDAGALTADVASGAAVAIVASENDPEGFDRILAIYPDGRAYLWRQLNEKYQD